ncbi:sulfite exporter TauE/SafE family protein [Janibacter alittae]|uniref:Probable membrane transporter protein n=1 Tax=Janibacter alittae TaxID=3115209 RepID=A0ABZ2MD67_9MICO
MIGWLDPTILALGLAVGAGAFVQSSIGFGIAVVSAPVIVVVEPQLMPVSLMVCAIFLPCVQLAGGPRVVSWQPLGWSLAARLLATPLGVVIVAVTSADAIALIVGVLILVTVAVSVRAVDVRPTRGSMLAAGAISGVSGTAASIGGPFMALAMQHEPPHRLRATLAVFFIVGTGVSLAGLALAGQVSAEQLRAGLTWWPCVVAGHLAAGPVRARLDAGALRRVVLAFCVVASLGVIIRTLI